MVIRIRFSGLVGYLTGDDRNRLELFHQWVERVGFLPHDVPTIDARAGFAANVLVDALLNNPSHVLRLMRHMRLDTEYNVRPPLHPFLLHAKDSNNYLARHT